MNTRAEPPNRSLRFEKDISAHVAPCPAPGRRFARPLRIFFKLRAFFSSWVPLGYEDDSGFHFGESP